MFVSYIIIKLRFFGITDHITFSLVNELLKFSICMCRFDDKCLQCVFFCYIGIPDDSRKYDSHNCVNHLSNCANDLKLKLEFQTVLSNQTRAN